MRPLLEQVLEHYPEDVKLVFKHFPLRNHRHAMAAAQASLAAGQQGKFWEYHDLVFDNLKDLGNEQLLAFADQLGLDRERFEQDQASAAVSELIRRDLREGQRAGVRGTPTIFVNGRPLRQRSLQGFRAAVEAALAQTKAAPR